MLPLRAGVPTLMPWQAPLGGENDWWTAGPIREPLAHSPRTGVTIFLSQMKTCSPQRRLRGRGVGPAPWAPWGSFC